MQFGAEFVVLVAIVGSVVCGRSYFGVLRRRGGFGGWRGWLLVACLLALCAVVVAGLFVLTLTAQIVRREARAVAELRQVIDAEREYAAVNDGYFDDLECLAMTRTGCAPLFRGPALVPDRIVPSSLVPGGYARVFHRGGAIRPQDSHGAASPSSIESFAYTMTPIAQAGRLALCGDSTGRVCYSWDEAPAVHDGACEAACTALEGTSWLGVYLLPRR